MNDIILKLLAAAVLLLLNGFFVLAEFALVKVRSSKLEELSRKGNKKARLAQKAAQNIDGYLSAIQLGITMASLGIGWLGEPALAKIIGNVFPLLSPGISAAVSYSVSLAVAFLIITSLHVILGEQVPKLIAIKSPARIAVWVSVPMTAFYYLTYVPMRVLTVSANFALKIMGFKSSQKETGHSDEEMKIILAQSQEQGKLSLGRLLMFENMFDFGHCAVKEIMAPRELIIYLSAKNTWVENLAIINKRRFSRYPLCGENIDEPLGYITVKDLCLDYAAGGANPSLTEKKRELLFIAEDAPIEKALREFQEKRRHLALVKNSAGKITGLLTLEDVLEELVGEIRDEFETSPATQIKKIFIPSAAMLDMPRTEKFAAIKNLLQKLHEEKPIFNIDEVWDLLVKREKSFSCALGHGTAFPHARAPKLSQTLVTFGRSQEGLDFSCMDNEPVKLMFLILTPLQEPTAQLRVLSLLAGVVSNYAIKKQLLSAKSAQEILEILTAYENKTAV
ncbi:MAG: CNNM domain-containing protein [Elusimicrobia bacterium]|nr:CNNM domain-containing protein [Elusimicrobiota bacterium]